MGLRDSTPKKIESVYKGGDHVVNCSECGIVPEIDYGKTLAWCINKRDYYLRQGVEVKIVKFTVTEQDLEL